MKTMIKKLLALMLITSATAAIADNGAKQLYIQNVAKAVTLAPVVEDYESEIYDYSDSDEEYALCPLDACLRIDRQPMGNMYNPEY